MRLRLGAALLALALAGPAAGQEAAGEAAGESPEATASGGDAFARSETAIDYEVVILGAPDERIESLLEDALLLFRRQEGGAPSLALLRRRAQGDVPTMLKALRSFGYFGAEAEVRVVPGDARPAPEAEEAADVEADAALAVGAEDSDAEARARRREERRARRVAAAERRRAARAEEDDEAAEEDEDEAAETETETEAEAEAQAEDDAARPARVIVSLRTGAPYALTDHGVRFEGELGPDGPPTLGPATAYGSPVGEAAEAARILKAEQEMVQDLRRSGRPYARGAGRRALADRAEATLEVTSRLEPGRAYVFGPTTFEGLERVDPEYLATYRPWSEGEPVDAEKLAEYQRALLSTDLFRAGRVTLPPEAPEGAAAPVTAALEEGPRRSFNFRLEWNTDTGPGVRTGFRHRNLFGSNETLIFNFDTTLEEQTGLLRYEVPQFRRRDGQLFFAQGELRNVESDAFDEQALTLSTGLQRRIGEHWTIGGGLLGETSLVDDTGIDGETSQLLAIPAFAAYDDTDSLLDPTRGQRLRISGGPWGGAWRGDGTAWLQTDLSGSVYRRLDADGRFVAAARARFGSILGPELARVPPPRRFYAGGGGSVRGLRKDFVGRVDGRNSPVGGLSVVETNAEMRARVWGPVSAVAFVDAGLVDPDPAPDVSQAWQLGAGLGARYASPIGPVRLDVGFPLRRRRPDDDFQVYFSIGQAF